MKICRVKKMKKNTELNSKEMISNGLNTILIYISGT